MVKLPTFPRFSIWSALHRRALIVSLAVLGFASCATTDTNHYRPALANQEQCAGRQRTDSPRQNSLGAFRKAVFTAARFLHIAGKLVHSVLAMPNV